MANLMMLATSLYRKLRGAEPTVRERLRPFLDEIVEHGAIPLGLRKNASGGDEYWWVVYDQGRHASPESLRRHLKERTPKDCKMVILTI